MTLIKTVFWKKNAVVLIDQNALPLVERQVVCSDYRQVIAAIRDLTVRGAPAIGVAAAMGAALGALAFASEPIEKFKKNSTRSAMKSRPPGPRPAIFSGQWSG